MFKFIFIFLFSQLMEAKPLPLNYPEFADFKGNNDCPEISVAANGNINNLIPDLPPYTLDRLLLFEFIPIDNLNKVDATEKVIKLGKSRIPEVIELLATKGILKEAQKVARIYGIDVLQVLAPIIGENVFNNFPDSIIMEKAQLADRSNLASLGRGYQALAQTPEIQRCMESSELSNFWKWSCMTFYLREKYPNLLAANLRKKGGTYGLAQMNPRLVWAFNDMVVKYSKLPKLNFADLNNSLDIVLEPKIVIHYVGAYVKTIVEIYKEVACYDISENTGLIATLYNLGGESVRANKVRDLGRAPQENFFGWFINYFEPQIRAELAKYL